MAVAERESRYMSKFARAIIMSKAVEAARRSVKVGDWVTVKEYPIPGAHNGRTISGQVIYKNEHYFTLQGRHYRESFRFINVALGQVEIG